LKILKNGFYDIKIISVSCILTIKGFGPEGP
jgi:hypothetical protein